MFWDPTHAALLGAGFFLISPCAAKCCIETVGVKRLTQSHRLHHVGMRVGAVIDRIDAVSHAVLVDMDDQIEPQILGHLVAERDHLAKFPGGVDMKKRKRRLGGIERLNGQPKHDRRILAYRIKHHRFCETGGHLTENVDCFRFKPIEVCQGQLLSPSSVHVGFSYADFMPSATDRAIGNHRNHKPISSSV